MWSLRHAAMKIINTQDALIEFCEAASKRPFLCVDTEFMREKTFFSILCLVQAATDEDEAIIDPLADGVDRAPFLELMYNPNIVKVMHAARQDMEIFYQYDKKLPAPLFDTQVAGMALGYGDSVSYGALVKGRLGRNLDKGARFTDWSRRPLTEKQLSYAMGDVTHLRDMYPGIVEELKERGRLSWIEAEMQNQMDESLYAFDPEAAWERLKIRSPKKDYLAALKAAAAWRETAAIDRDIPRRRVVSDDALYNIAQQRPRDLNALARLRGVPNGFERSRSAKALIHKLNDALDDAENYAPAIPKKKQMPPNLGPAIDMLKTLLRIRSEYDDIAPRLIATQSDIEQIAAFGEDANVMAMSGWRREIFGNDALRLINGELGLRLEGKKVVVTELG